MAAEIETGSTFTREKSTESALNKMDELPNVVQCGTIEDLLHRMAPQHVHAGKPQCWEDAWQQILQAVGNASLPQNMSCEESQPEELDVPQENAKAGLEQPNIDAGVSPEILSTFPFPQKNTWMLHFQVEDDIEAYLETFEWVARNHHWSKEEWVARLIPYLSHKALLAYSIFCHDMAHTYDAVKESILCRYGITPETQRLAFRECQYLETEGPREACQKLRVLAQRWLKPEKHTKEQILELLILEQFLTILPQEMRSWVRECNPQTCAQAVEIAEGFQLRNEPPVPFEDVCVKFSEEEWTFLTEKQRALYCDVTLENFQTISTMGIPFEKPEVIRQIQEKRTPCFQDDVPREDPEETPFTGVSLEKLEIFEQIQEKGTLIFQDDAPKEDSQRNPLSGICMEIFEQIQEEGKFSFKDDAPREDSQKSPLSDNAQLPYFNRHPAEKKIVSKKAEMDVEEQSTAIEVTQHHLDSVGATNVAFLSSKKQLPQCLKHSTAKKSPVKSHSPKKQGSASKIKARKWKKQQLPPVGEPDSGRKQLQPPLTGETTGELGSDTTISVSKNLKQKKGPRSQDGPSKPKKPLLSTGEPPKLKNKNEPQDEVPRLKKEPQSEKKESLQKESYHQQEKEQRMTMPLPQRTEPHKSVLSVFTWYPPFCATVLSDLTCPECGRTFRQRADLRHHRYVHTQEKPYACTVCDKHFRHPSNLHIHLRTHSGEKPHQCPECGKTFSQSCNLRTHRQIHSGNKPFSCCICGKTFRHRSNLAIHERMHTGERPYPCSICGKRFADRSTMVQHERIHTGEKPYACDVCEQKFSQISHLKKHCRVHPGARGPTKPKSSEVHSLSLPRIVSHSPRGKTPSE